MTRAQRRTSDFKAKARATARLKRYARKGIDPEPTPRAIGRDAAQHGTCSCWACTTKEGEDKKRFLSDLTKLHADT